MKAPIAALALAAAASSTVAQANGMPQFASIQAPHAAANCIVASLDRNAQVHASARGMIVTVFAPRAHVARWSVVHAPQGSAIQVERAIPGLERVARGECYR